MPDNTHRREPFPVALRKESVDRNPVAVGSLSTLGGSLSARRAWIEIKRQTYQRYKNPSLSARRAWIEIRLLLSLVLGLSVALRKESVDRNDLSFYAQQRHFSRSPQGERG